MNEFQGTFREMKRRRLWCVTVDVGSERLVARFVAGARGLGIGLPAGNKKYTGLIEKVVRRTAKGEVSIGPFKTSLRDVVRGVGACRSLTGYGGKSVLCFIRLPGTTMGLRRAVRCTVFYGIGGTNMRGGIVKVGKLTSLSFSPATCRNIMTSMVSPNGFGKMKRIVCSAMTFPGVLNRLCIVSCRLV